MRKALSVLCLILALVLTCGLFAACSGDRGGGDAAPKDLAGSRYEFADLNVTFAADAKDEDIQEMIGMFQMLDEEFKGTTKEALAIELEKMARAEFEDQGAAVVFLADGKVELTSKGDDGETGTEKGTYTVSGKTVTILPEDGDEEEKIEMKLDGGNLIYPQDEDGVILNLIFKRK